MLYPCHESFQDISGIIYKMIIKNQFRNEVEDNLWESERKVSRAGKQCILGVLERRKMEGIQEKKE